MVLKYLGALWDSKELLKHFGQVESILLYVVLVNVKMDLTIEFN